MKNNNSIKYQHYQLTPLVSKWVVDVVNNTQLFDLIETYNSPINIQHAASFEENLKAYEQVFSKYALKHKIYFARKANKSKCFVRKAAKLNHGVDTASYRELAQALELGLNKEHLISTAAVKNKQLINLCVEHHIPIVIDNLDECDLIQQVCENHNSNIEIFIRLNGFSYHNQILKTRFGFNIMDVPNFIQTELSENGKYNRLQYRGLHFHLNGYSIEQRSECLLQSIQLADKLTKLGIQTKSIDFGGGILVNYLSSKDEYQHFGDALKKSLLHEIPAITYQNDGLGMTVINNEIIGEATVYPYYNEVNKGVFLDQILNYKNKKNESIYKLIKDRDIELRIEPGRSLLDQAGITVAKVAFRKKDTDGEWLIGLEMNRTQLRSGSADFLLDPIHIPSQRENDPTEMYGYLVGAYCLEQELILKRKIKFNQFPRVGDLVAFVNTAGYMMHFYESEAHLFELAQNIVYNSKKNTFSLDEETKALKNN